MAKISTDLNGSKNISETKMEEIQFTVDAALLRELGERLVGKPHIALAELVKNSYDADATKVIIRFGPDKIEVVDNGHGMDFTEFKEFWMRVGSPHKQELRYSRKFERPMTGSKGVGRLAAQFLAREIRMHTVSERDIGREIEVVVNWDEAVQAGELTHAVARFREIESITEFPEKDHGTVIILSDLNQTWDSNAIEELAKEIWPLQPPFRITSDATGFQEHAFDVELESPDPEVTRRFEEQMSAILKLWSAKINGRLTVPPKSSDCKVNWVLEFSDGTQSKYEYSVPDCNLHSTEFEIRIFTLRGKQPYGIIVDEARDYFRRFGGVHVYDAGFHLPYYGTVESDWLRIQYDHASRIHRSQLLPEELHVHRGLQFLPTLSRIFGVVHVNTSYEQQKSVEEELDSSGEYLKIQVTRDRLVDNSAYQSLIYIIRFALDYYAMREAARQYAKKEAQRSVEPIQRKFERVDDILEKYKEDIPRPVYRDLNREVKDAIRASEVEDELIARQTGLLGALATAGMSALAYEHEAKKQHSKLLEITQELESIGMTKTSIQERLNGIIRRLHVWLKQSRAMRALFTNILDEENRTMVDRFKTKELVRDVSDNLGLLLRGIKPRTYRIDDTLRLPKAGFAEWSAIFQNVLLNATNAMLDSQEKKIDVSSRSERDKRILLIQDTGVGVDLVTSEDLFKPFVRKLEISPERRALGLGGSGLGLTIVRMIANNIGCEVSFVEPEGGYSTALQIQWRESK